jgi:hypothetical protein
MFKNGICFRSVHNYAGEGSGIKLTPSVCPSVCMKKFESEQHRLPFTKFLVENIVKKLSSKVNFYSDWTIVMTILHESISVSSYHSRSFYMKKYLYIVSV